MAPDPLHERIRGLLARRRANGNLRTLDPPAYDPASLVDFSSNDYLSLSKSPELRSHLLDSLSSSPAYGPASSRLLDGNSTDHLRLEAQLAEFFQGESALLFNSGFDANAGLFACLPGADDVLLYDSLIHASVHDGMRHSRCKVRKAFKHNDVQDLKGTLRAMLQGAEGEGFRSGHKQVFVAAEALYSMDGDLAPMEAILDAVEEALPAGNGHLIIDEAHSTGLYGKEGRGLTCALGLENRVLVRLHTFGKAMACSGGAIICSPTVRSYLINYARPLIYSTVMTSLSVAAIQSSLQHLRRGAASVARQRLHTNIRHYQSQVRKHLVNIPLVSLPSRSPQDSLIDKAFPSPIVPILTPRPRDLSSYLIRSGYLVRPIAHPTVPKGEERVRICLHANNTAEEIDGLIATVNRWSREQSSMPQSATSSSLQAKL